MKKSLLALGLAATLTTGAASGAHALPTGDASGGNDPVAMERASGGTAHKGLDPTMIADRTWSLFDTSSDVNGDGAIDGVWLRKKSDTVCQVKVTMGTKHSPVRNLRSPRGNPCAYGGSALFDTKKGAEVNVVTALGAHTRWSTILTFGDGRLVVQKAPGRSRWAIDSTSMFSEGYKRVHNPQGQVRMVHDFSVREHGNNWRGTRKVLAFRGGEWVQVRKTEPVRTTSQAKALAGWNLPGFKRWM